MSTLRVVIWCGVCAVGVITAAAQCAPRRCQSDADCPLEAPICFLSECGATEPPFFGQQDQPCTYNGVCDEGLRCIEDDGDEETRPNCRGTCALSNNGSLSNDGALSSDEGTCPSGFVCVEVPSTPGEGVCLPDS